MEYSDFDRQMRRSERNVTFYGHIGVLIVRNGFGETVEILDAWDLTRTWLKTSNDAFFERYGFNWVPPGWMQDSVRDGMKGRGRYGSQ